MEINNTTGQDTRYKVTGGGGVAPHARFSEREAETWATLPAYSSVQHTPILSGPWKVYFFVDGESVVANVGLQAECVELAATGGKLKAHVRNGKLRRAS